MAKLTDATRQKRRRGEASEKLDKLGIEFVCDEIASGKSLSLICEGIGIVRQQLINWVRADTDRSDKYDAARVDRADAYADQAEDALRLAKDPLELKRAAYLSHHWRWWASKIRPQQYGDKLDLNHTGEIKHTDDQLDARINSLGTAIANAVAKTNGVAIPGPDSGESET